MRIKLIRSLVISILILGLLGGYMSFAVEDDDLPLGKPFQKLQYLGIGKVSIYVKDLRTNKTFGINENYVNKEGDAGMCAASVIKMHVAYYLVHEIKSGNLSWTKVYKDPVNGRKFTIKEEMRKMIVVSDNNSYNTFLRFLTPKKINQYFEEMGLKYTHVYAEIGPAGYGWSKKNNVIRYGVDKGGRINALETATVLEHIYSEKNDKDMRMLHQYMTQVTNRKRIPDALGGKIVVAHKTGTVGDADGIFSDAGIVYGHKGNYLMVVLTQNQTYKIDSEIRKAVKASFDILEQLKITKE